MNPPTNS